MPRRRRPPRPGALADLAPLRILTQIAVLQTCYYAIALVLIVFTAFVAGQHPNPGLLLDWRNVRSDVTTGWTLALCWGLDGLMMVTYPPPDRAQQTRPRLRPDHPHASSHCDVALHPRHSEHALLVVYPSMLCCDYDWSGCLGVPMERAKAYGIRWEGEAAGREWALVRGQRRRRGRPCYARRTRTRRRWQRQL